MFRFVSISGWLIPIMIIVMEKPVFGQQTKSAFSCDGRTSGYYADVSTGCQVYHMCDGLGRQFSYRCPSKTLFQQRMLICDHWYMVNCSKAEEDYSANLLIGQQGKPFVEDLQFHRTPRPDLADPRVSSNIVEPEGVSTEYFAPSHWSTEATPTKKPESPAPVLVKQSYYRTDYNSRGKILSSGVPEEKKSDSQSVNQVNLLSGVGDLKAKAPSRFKATPDSEVVGTVNFPSKFRATTPVYPKHVDVDPSRLSEFDISIDDGFQPEDQTPVNFPSKFKATTPIYPERVEIDLSKLSDFDVPLGAEEVLINFASNFKATTPVYPKTVDVDLKKFSEVEELPPVLSEDDSPIVNFASKFKATTPVYPKEVFVDLSKFKEPLEIPKSDNDDDDTVVNFVSSFRATTPVYPQSVEATSPIPEEFGLLPPKSDNNSTQPNNDVVVNFVSSFKATTPDYPKSVEATSPDPSNVGLAAPEISAQPSLNIEPPSFEDTFKRRIDDEPSVIGHTFNNQQLNEFMVTIKPEQLKDLKQLWKIPEYDFPLETVVRPGYESEVSSFRSGSTSKS